MSNDEIIKISDVWQSLLRNRYVDETSNIRFKDIVPLYRAIDKEAVLEKNAGRFSYKVWDKKSSLDGMSADEIIKNHLDGNRDNAAYLLFDSGNLMSFVTNSPFDRQRMTAENVMETAERQVVQLSYIHTNEEIVKIVIEGLLELLDKKE